MTIDEYYGSDSTRDAFAKYRRDGFALFPKLFSDAEVDDLLIRAMLHRSEEQKGAAGRTGFWGAPRLLEIVSEALGTNEIRHISQQICCREPGDGETTGWSRDETAARVDDPRCSSVALALYLDDVSRVDQGVVLFVPGSHEWPAQAQGQPVEIERSEAMLARRGMIGLRNAGTLHRPLPNRTNRGRRSLLQVYVRADASAGADG